jgi:hypothetical protein
LSFENRAGVFVVRYDSPSALDPTHQHDLVAALRSASVLAPVGVVFVVAPSVQMVGREVPEYWLTVTGDKGIRIAAMAVVTPNAAVSVAARGFSTINILRETSVLVRPFPEEAPAMAWVRAQLAGQG